MKALSIRQPWAWLIVNGYKDIENRTWATKHRGPLLIHASKTLDKDGLEWVKENFPAIDVPTDFEKGGIVGYAEINYCVDSSPSLWFFGPYGFELGNTKPMPFVPMAGKLGIFQVEQWVTARLHDELNAIGV